VCKVFKQKNLHPDFPVQAHGLNEKARLSAELSYLF